MDTNRRRFIRNGALTAASGILWTGAMAGLGGESREEDGEASGSGEARKIRVLVWDERADTEKGYEHFLGNYIAGELAKDPAFSVSSAGLDDAGQGIPDSVLDQTDVLLWWGHTRQAEISPEKGKEIVSRIEAGRLSLIALHSAHWSTPFVSAMNEITRQNVWRAYPGVREDSISYVQPPTQFAVPKYDSRLTPYTTERRFPDGRLELQVHLPFCCFPAYRNDGKPSTIKVLRPEHPIMKGLPASFVLPQTEMYDEPFHVPPPDEVLFEESWAGGEWFRSGMLWRLGKGRVFYFRPGHEEYPVFKEERVMQVLRNAVRWLGGGN